MPNEGDIRKAVRGFYAGLTAQPSNRPSCCSPRKDAQGRCGSGCAPPYSDRELSLIPARARGMTAGCGNPVAMARIKPGEVVLDLGSGAGGDAFLAAAKTGAKGKVIGVDSTPEMIWRAREAAREASCGNVEFRLGEIEHLPVESGSVDVVISNCVINLSPDKDAVFKEAFRVLRPGGRMAISDIVISGTLPEEIRSSAVAWAGCVSGAISEEEYLTKMARAGFTDIQVRRRVPLPFEAIAGCLPHSCNSARNGGRKRGSRISSFEIISEDIVAIRPGKA